MPQSITIQIKANAMSLERGIKSALDANGASVKQNRTQAG
jgi:hypothetical protein